MNNALLYCVNNNKWNKTYLHQMVNSINSFYHYNPKTLLDTITVYILTDKKEGLDLSKLNPEVKYVVIDESEFSYDYSTMPKNTKMPHLTYHAYFRWEMFHNPIFRDIDTILYLDCDTEVIAPIDELFIERKAPRIGLVPERRPQFKILYDEDLGAYYNSGVIMYTPKLMKQDVYDQLFNRVVQLAKDNNYVYSDQCALNYALKEQPFIMYVMDLNEQYNSFIETYRKGKPTENPKILHYSGNTGLKLYTLKYI